MSANVLVILWQAIRMILIIITFIVIISHLITNILQVIYKIRVFVNRKVVIKLYLHGSFQSGQQVTIITYTAEYVREQSIGTQC